MTKVLQGETESYRSVITSMYFVQALVQDDIDLDVAIVFKKYTVAVRGRLVFFVDI